MRAAEIWHERGQSQESEVVGRSHIDESATPPISLDDACAACGAGHDDARQEAVLRLRRQVADGAYQPPVDELVECLIAFVARRAELGRGFGE
jgi:hypothetical protein